MALAKVVDGKTVVDEIKVDLVKKEGKDMFLIKSYKQQKNQYRPFYPKKAIYKRTKKAQYEMLIDHATLDQLDYKEAFQGGGLDPKVEDLDRQAEDVLAAHKETKKRMSTDTQNLAILISWIGIIIVAILLTITFYMWWSTPHTITILCQNCGSVIATNGIKAG